MNEKTITALTPEAHKSLGIDLFNFTWTLIEKPDRTPADTDLMLHAAHASAFHWRQVGTPLNFARSHWQISRVSALAGLGEAAIFHGKRSLEIALENGIADFDLAFAHEAIARGAKVAGITGLHAEHLALAEQAGAKIAKQGDRDHFSTELETAR